MKLQCRQCGMECDEGDWKEGVCCWCWDANQSELDFHNEAYDAWKRKTDEQKDTAIRNALRFS